MASLSSSSTGFVPRGTHTEHMSRGPWLRNQGPPSPSILFKSVSDAANGVDESLFIPPVALRLVKFPVTMLFSIFRH